MPKVALIYDHLATPHGGAEKVLAALHEAYPDAPLFTSIYNKNKTSWADSFEVKTTFLQKIPFINTHHRLATLGMPLAFETFQLEDFDIIISISSSCAKGVITKPQQLHINYLLTPTRFLFSHEQEYLDSHSILKIPFISHLVELAGKYLKWWDTIAIHRPDTVVCISNIVAERTKTYYGRKPDSVIYPPVDIVSTENNEKLVQKEYFLSLSRLVPYKKIDFCIEACLELHQPLIIAGDGPAKTMLSQIHPYTFIRDKEESLKSFLLSCFSQYSAPVCFVGTVTEEEKWQLITNSKAVLMPGIEDFGITALEAVSAGVPTVIHKESGVAEILNEDCAVMIEEESVEAVIKALVYLQKATFDSDKLKKKAIEYSKEKFISSFRKYVDKSYKEFLTSNF